MADTRKPGGETAEVLRAVASGKTDVAEALAQISLGRSLEEWVRERRAAGQPWSAVSRDLYIETNGDISLTGETLRVRYPDARAAS